MQIVRCTAFVFLLAAVSARAAIIAQPIEGGARAGGLGGAVSALEGDLWSVDNPAGRGTIAVRTVGFFATEGFGMAELRLGAVAVAVPTRVGVVAVRGRTFGFEEFRENRYTVGFTRAFRISPSRRVLGGIDLTYYQVQIAGYGSAGALGVTVGWMSELFPGISAGFSAVNLNAPEYAPGEPLDRAILVGLRYEPDARLRLLADLRKDSRFPLSPRAGIELVPVPPITLRMGAGIEPVRFTAGAGVQSGRLRGDLAAHRHEVLGWTPAVSVEIGW